MTTKIVLSTDNKNKVKEIQNIMADLPVKFLSKSDLGLGKLQVVEDGDSLEENSLKKAKALADKTEYMVMADDSGLFVDILGGDPGVHSSRYGGQEGNDQLNKERLIREMAPYSDSDRKAAFKTVISLIDEKKEEHFFHGSCPGRIIEEARGNKGFGYDPLFKPQGYEQTFAQMEEDLKNKISHRYEALNELREFLKQKLTGDANENISD